MASGSGTPARETSSDVMPPLPSLPVVPAVKHVGRREPRKNPRLGGDTCDLQVAPMRLIAWNRSGAFGLSSRPTKLRAEGRPGRTLPPLARPRTRIILLSSSYLDAVTASNDSIRTGRTESSLPAHNPELWPHGSYEDLERAWNRVPSSLDVWFRAFWQVYVTRGSKLVLDPAGAIIGYEGDPRTSRRVKRDSHGRVIRRGGEAVEIVETQRPFREFPVNAVVQADTILRLLEKDLARSRLHVPAPVSEAAGYGPGDARAWDRWPEKEVA